MNVLLILNFASQTPCLKRFMFWSVCPECTWPIRLQNSLKTNIYKKGIKMIFCLQINIKVSYKLVLLILAGVARRTQSSQSNKL